MSSYLGLSPPLTLAQLDLLYVSCNFDFAWRSAPGAGPWCALFTLYQMEVMEYRYRWMSWSEGKAGYHGVQVKLDIMEYRYSWWS